MMLLEREQHLDRLADLLRHAAAGRGGLVFVGGEAGVGKTSLVDQFCRLAGDVAVLRASCDCLSTPGPLGPVRDLAPALGLVLDRTTLDGDARDRLFRQMLAALAARPGPTVVVGEDAHWADGASLELLRFLGRRIGDLPVLVVVTYRDDEVGGNHPLRLVLGDLATATAVHRMSVPALSEAAVARLAMGSGRDAAALYRQTSGNPFFVTEALSTDDAAVPATVGDAVLARAARLSPEARAVLDVAAVIGATIDPHLLTKVAGPVLAEADECVERGLLCGTDQGLCFRHELARQAILAAVALPRRRFLHAQVLAALLDSPPAERDLARLAHHAEAANDRAAVLEFATAAADQAVALRSHREAAAQFARALRFGGGLPDAERARLLEARSVACYLSDQGEEALVAGQEALALRRGLDDRLKEGDTLRWLSRFYWYQGRGAEAEAAATAALDLLETLPPGPELAMAYSNLAQLRMLALDLDGALAWGHRAIALAESLGEAETLAHALTNVGTARLERGDDRGRPDLERAIRLARERGFADHAGRALVNDAFACLAMYRLDDADRRLVAGIAYATEHDLDSYRLYLHALRADLCLRRGQWDEAMATATPLLDRPVLSPLTRTTALTVVGRTLARRGEPGAEPLLDEALALAEPTGELYRLGTLRAARAEAALLLGDWRRAVAEVRAIQALAFDRGSHWHKGELAWLLWRAGEHEVPPTTDLAEPFACQIAGDWQAASALWERIGCPYESARALAEGDDPDAVRQAVAIFEELGARPAAAEAVRRLRALGVRDLPTQRRGPRATTRANPAGLTRREAEVLELVVAGLRNADIAERLYLTPKTVSHHLTAVFAKLGVATRTEAARAAAQLGIFAP